MSGKEELYEDVIEVGVPFKMFLIHCKCGQQFAYFNIQDYGEDHEEKGYESRYAYIPQVTAKFCPYCGDIEGER